VTDSNEQVPDSGTSWISTAITDIGDRIPKYKDLRQ